MRPTRGSSLDLMETANAEGSAMKPDANNGDIRAICLIGPIASYFGHLSVEPGLIEAQPARMTALATGVRTASHRLKTIWAIEVSVLPGLKRLMMQLEHEQRSVFAIPISVGSQQLTALLEQNGFSVRLQDSPRWLPNYFGLVWLYYKIRGTA